MAKTKISDVAKTYGVDNKEVIAFLNENGIEAKTAQKTIDDDAIAMVAKKFGSSTPAAAAPVKETAPQAQAPAQDAAPKAAAASADTASAQPVKKKKKIIIVTGANSGNRPAGNNYVGGYTNNKQSNYRPQNGQGGNRGGQNGRPAQGGQNRPAAGVNGAYRPIKPKTVPTQMKADTFREEKAATAPAAQNKPVEETTPQTLQNVTPVTDTPKVVEQQTATPAAETVQAAPAASQNKAAEAAPKAAEQQNTTAPAQSAPTEKKERPNIFANSNGPRPNIYTNSRNGQNGNRGDRGGRNAQGGQNGQGGRGNVGSRIRMNDNIGRNSQQGGYRGGQNGQGGYRGGQNGQGGYRGGQNGQGGYRGGQGAGAAQGGAGFGADNKRRGNQFKDKRNKKDLAFAEDELRESKRAGRFIKPTAVQEEAPEEQIKVITIPEKLTIGELAEAMHLKPADLIKKLFLAGKMMTQNSEVSYEEAENIAADYDILCEKEEKVDEIQELLREEEEDPDKLVDRAPVICVMGHVDHGKTSILDYIRDAHVTAKEAGGITQAIGAYTVETEDGRTITFLDTPGHEAFTAMRLRGAMSTDIAVLVVAADDGVMPQTVEAINHAKAAGVEIIVAVNKMDKPDANPDRVKEQLSKYELIPTDWGGTTEFVPVSAKTGQGIDDLLSTILLTADILELKANPDRLARGLVLEARLDKGRGPVANVLVQKGTLHVGDFVSAGPAFGRVRAMINDKGQNVKEAGPSMPVMVMGLSDVPSAGEVIVGHETNDEAKSYAQTYKAQHKEELVAENVMSMTTEDLFDQMREGKLKQLELIVKADVQGSVEALCASLRKLSNDEVAVKIIHSAVGNISESDVTLAEASNAAIIGFNVHPDATAKSIADHGGVSIHLYKVIYQAIDDVDAALKGMLAPVYEEKVIGHAEIRQLFKSGKIGNIAGSMVLDGVIEKGCSVRITRKDESGHMEQVYDGELASLKRFKDDVKEVKAGFDCGLVFKDWDSMQVDDQIEAYKMVEVPREQVIAMKEKEKAAKEKAAQSEQ